VKTLVIGMGRSGRAATQLLRKKKIQVTCFDDHLGPAFSGQMEFDFVVISPGIPLTHSLVIHAKEKGIEVIGEAELGLRYLKNRMIGVTGTNGKTTVTTLITHVLNHCGKKAIALGNIGKPLCEYALNPDSEEIIIIELSSFQLETLSSKVFDCGVILNITPDHLDRHSSMEEYTSVKWQLKNCMKKNGVFFTENSYLHLSKKIEYSPANMLGKLNVRASFAICQQLGISSAEFCSAILTFKKPPHRLNLIKKIDGISFYDDSKGTTVEATLFALESIDKPIWLIAGGLDKGGDFSKWKKPFREKVKGVFVIGKAAPLIEGALQDEIEVVLADSIEEAVQKAFRKAVKGDVILCSPGCASYDMFRDYIERGKRFQKAVRDLL